MSKPYLRILPVSVLAALLSLPAWSANPEQAQPGYQGSGDQQSGQSGMEQQPANQPLQSNSMADSNPSPMLILTPNDLKGRDVINVKGESIGEVKDVVADKTTEEFFAVISVGGFMGIGDSKRLVPVDNLRFKGDMLHVNQTTEEVSSQPEYTAEGYVSIMPDDQPMSEFSAFEATAN